MDWCRTYFTDRSFDMTTGHTLTASTGVRFGIPWALFYTPLRSFKFLFEDVSIKYDEYADDLKIFAEINRRTCRSGDG